MKTLLITFTILFSLNSFASRTYSLKNEGTHAAIRHGGYFDEPVFTNFDTELEVKLAHHKVQIDDREDTYYTDAILKYDYDMPSDQFYRLLPKATITGSLTFLKNRAPYKTVEFIVKCGYLVQDGGNSTLKMNCVKSLAKAIEKTLKENAK